MKTFSKKMFEQVHDISDVPLAKHVLSGVEYKYWIKYKNTDFLYKQDSKDQLGFFELLCSHLSQKVGFDCVNCYPANDGYGNGIIVESYLSPEVIRTISLDDLIDEYKFKDAIHVTKMGNGCWFSIDEFFKNKGVLENEGIYLAPNLREKFEQMALVDFLLAQMDRHELNVEFLLFEDKLTGKKILDLAPMYDNGRILGATRFNLLATPQQISQDTYPQITISFHEPKSGKNEADCIAKTLAEQIRKKPHLAKIYNAFKKLDFAKEVMQVAQTCEYKLSTRKLHIIESVYKDRMGLVEKHLQKLDEKTSQPKVSKKLEICARYDDLKQPQMQQEMTI